jgi:hypothetical protein
LEYSFLNISSNHCSGRRRWTSHIITLPNSRPQDLGYHLELAQRLTDNMKGFINLITISFVLLVSVGPSMQASRTQVLSRKEACYHPFLTNGKTTVVLLAGPNG